MLLELLVPGFVLCFFGLSAVTVGGLRLLFGESFGLAWQLAAFSAFSVAYIVLLRRWFKRALVGDKGEQRLRSEFVGRIGKVVEAVNPPIVGRVMIGDAEWAAVADKPIAAGADVKVISHNNLTMKVEAI